MMIRTPSSLDMVVWVGDDGRISTICRGIFVDFYLHSGYYEASEFPVMTETGELCGYTTRRV